MSRDIPVRVFIRNGRAIYSKVRSDMTDLPFAEATAIIEWRGDVCEVKSL